MQLHTPSLLLANIAVAVALCACLAAVASRERRDGLIYWAWALAAQAMTYILFALRGQVSDWISIVLANGLLSAAFALFAMGLYQFHQQRAPRLLLWLPMVGGMVMYGMLLPHPFARMILATLIFTAQVAWLLYLMLTRHRQTVGRGQYFVIAGFILVIGGLLVRASVGLLAGMDLAMGSSAPIQTFTLLLATVNLILVNIGLVLMTKERADARNRTLALEDELTGLNNRRALMRQLARHRGMAHRNKRPLSLLVIDIDHFKMINDTHGHPSGDKALRELAVRIQGRLRTQDILGRWGGEEFMAILPETDAIGGAALAEQLRLSVEEMHFSSVEGSNMPLTISIGLHALNPSAEDTRDDMISAADRALYLAKQNGRNRVEEL